MLVLNPELETMIKSEGEKSYPNECCGILIGEIDGDGAKTAKQTQPIINASEDDEQYHRFLITPEDIMEAERTARKAKLDVVGFYHSHPDHPAAPSEYDKEHALPFYSYVIVSVEKGSAKEMTSWELTADRVNFMPEKIFIE